MRVEIHSTGSILHIIQRGTRGVNIAPTEAEQWRFIKNLFYLNSIDAPRDWERDTYGHEIFEWPSHWKSREQLVDVLAWTLMSNHFHLVLCEIQPSGISKFMQRLGGSMTKYFNSLHNEKGTLFQGGYKGRIIADTDDLRYVSAYVMGKNVFELYPGGIDCAISNFSSAWQFGLDYQFSSLSQYATGRHCPIMPSSGNILVEIFESPERFKKNVEDMILGWSERNIKDGFVSSRT